LSYLHMHLGNLILETDPVSARSEFQTSLQRFDDLPIEQRQKRAQVRFRALLLRKIAASDRELGLYSLAAPLFAGALTTYRQLSDNDSSDTGALGDLYRVLTDQAANYEYAADPLLLDSENDTRQGRQRSLHAAAASLQQCAAALQRILQLAPSQTEWKAVLADVQLRLNAVHQALGEPALSSAEISAALAETIKPTKSSQASAGDMDIAVHALLCIPVKALRNPSLAVRLAERGVSLTHRREATYLLLLARAQRADNQPDAASVTARRGLDLLPPTVIGEPRSRLRRLLEAQLKSAKPTR
jgi:hypothetical protein